MEKNSRGLIGGWKRGDWREAFGLMKAKDFLRKLIVGVVIGIAMITPGLSGGVLAAASGIYEPSVKAIVQLRRRFAWSFVFLLPLGIGLLLGVGGFSGAMKVLIAKWPFAILYVFLGLVAGSIPALIGEANEGGFKLRYLLWTLVGIAVVAAFEYMSDRAVVAADAPLTPARLLVCGAVLAFGTIVPGISSSFILMYMGVYERLLVAVTSFDFRTILFIGLSFAVTALLIIKLVEVLFRKFHGPAYYAVLGFLLGSMVMVFPGFRGGLSLAFDALLFIGSAALSFLVLRMKGATQ